MEFLRRTLWIAAFVDLALAPLALVPVVPVADALGIPVGEPVMHLRFAGLLLVLLPVFYIVGARDPRTTVPITGVAIVARLAGVLFMGGHVLWAGAPPAYWLFAGLDATMGVLHAVALARVGFSPLAALRATSGPSS